MTFKCIMVSDGRCVMCDRGVVEDVAHFLVSCGEFVRDPLDVCSVWANEWLDEFWRVDEEGKVALLLG